MPLTCLEEGTVEGGWWMVDGGWRGNRRASWSSDQSHHPLLPTIKIIIIKKR